MQANSNTVASLLLNTYTFMDNPSILELAYRKCPAGSMLSLILHRCHNTLFPPVNRHAFFIAVTVVAGDRCLIVPCKLCV